MENYSKKFKEAIIGNGETISRKLNSMSYPRGMSAIEMMKKIHMLLNESTCGFSKKMRNTNIGLNDVLNKNESLLPILDTMVYDSLYLFTQDALDVIECFNDNFILDKIPDPSINQIEACVRNHKQVD